MSNYIPQLRPRIAQGRLVIGVDRAMYGQHYFNAIQAHRNANIVSGVCYAKILKNTNRAYELFCIPKFIDGNLKLVQ